MHRRTLLGTVAASVTLAGCVTDTGRSPNQTTTIPSSENSSGPSPKTPTDTSATVEKTDNGIRATFQIITSHTPTADTVDATFGDQKITVTGTMDPANCNEPTLESVSYDATAERITLTVGESSPYDGTPDIVCDNASFDFRCEVTSQGGQLSVVEVIYDHPHSDNQTFVIRRD